MQKAEDRHWSDPQTSAHPFASKPAAQTLPRNLFPVLPIAPAHSMTKVRTQLRILYLQIRNDAVTCTEELQEFVLHSQLDASQITTLNVFDHPSFPPTVSTPTMPYLSEDPVMPLSLSQSSIPLSTLPRNSSNTA